MKSYGTLCFTDKAKRSGNKNKGSWELTDVAPHAAIALRNVFKRVSGLSRRESFSFDDTLDNAADLDWFMVRYPFDMDAKTKRTMKARLKELRDREKQCDLILSKGYERKSNPSVIYPNEFRDHQMESAALVGLVKRLIVVDDVGMGKSYSAIACALDHLPAVIVCDPVNQDQFDEKILGFVDLKVLKANGSSPKDEIPRDTDIIILKYNQLSGWYKALMDHKVKSIHFDEVQNLRHGANGSDKGSAAKAFADSLDVVVGYTATLIYNYGIEAWNIFNIINPGLLGNKDEFIREWCTDNEKRVADPDALGLYLQDRKAVIRHKKPEDESRYPYSEIITVEPDFDEVKKTEDLAKSLAMKVLSVTDFKESGMLSREFDIQMRKMTGMAKARQAAAAAKVLLSQGKPVILFGFHHEVYRIWEEELSEHNPAWYTGKQTNSQKNKSKRAFIESETNLLIMSIRTGVGVDGLQVRAPWIVFGELDWSKQIHLQNIGRGDREGNPNPQGCGSVYVTTEYGSDPIMLSVLDIKSKQGEGIQNPSATKTPDNSLASGLMAGRFKQMAEDFLQSKGELVSEDALHKVSSEQLAMAL